eukprot:gnl/TRDRNA2_/TRDRNA2_151472_c0_seq1.p1 gnl/TRDRNA2_/TRDRNA2_151472_c0~~gnl/TRDRNA2_/TRDRNA2_151472_c0_seq1.p1  ORF type:complete len:357 (+),score=29.78 gnl/TRDRNA2_/TRDRNA2_151472_c0_seq1:84-1154(+)
MGVVSDIIETEHTFTIMNLSLFLLFIVTVNHVIACLWYLTGRLSMEAGNQNWIETSNTKGMSLGYEYTTSLHWSLTQFTPASMSVSATNIAERVFSIVVLFFALVTFSSIVASITAAMTQIRNRRGDEMKQFWLLRRYLRQQQISKELGQRVVKFLEFEMDRRRDLVKEQSVSILKLLSTQLQSELTSETLKPHLSGHPFFDYLGSGMCAVMYEIARSAIGTQTLATMDIVFTGGDEARSMFFIRSGDVCYELSNGNVLEPPVQPGEWIAEPVLWTLWRHLGTLWASSLCDMLTVDPKKFGEVMCYHPRPWYFARHYADQFLTFINSQAPDALTDVMREFDYEMAVHEAIAQDVAG